MMAGEYGEPWEYEWNEDGPYHELFTSDQHVTSLDEENGRECDRIVVCVNALEGIRDPAAFVHAARDAAEKLHLAATIAREHGYVHSSDSFVEHADRLRAELGGGDG